ncbi:Oligopeptide transport system permease protein oppB [Raoultella planticola]|uniref:Oligopeptide transport system permease protein oppB n=1 Tax=Raoultella planticola TaxID=575 RepID=A0A485AF74_RAOPL|nr:Oligopeptide transport system permease protein oppB [Raoultella planticola]
MIEVLHSNFIRTAARERAADAAHYFASCAETRSAAGSFLYGASICGDSSPAQWSSETIYGLPGIGQLFVNGALNRDYSLVLSLTILVGALTILFNAIVDVLYAVIDPKIRY